MIDLDDMAARAIERIHRSVGQRARYAKALLAFDVDRAMDNIELWNRPVFSDEILAGAISSDKIGRRRWDADESHSAP